MILRARLDLSWPDLAYAALSCVLPARRDALEERIRGAFPEPDHALVCLSVRSGFDLLLDALGLPEGSEVLLSAVTVPDMARIVRAHGLVPVPVDLDTDTLTPTADALVAAHSPRARVLVVAHLFGAVSDFEEARAFARRNGLLFVEDCAQSYVPGRFSGSPDSDVRMLSFGPIKTSTALAGAVLLARDRELLFRMADIQTRLPLQGRSAYASRVLKFGALQLMTLRGVFALFRAACRLAGRDYDAVIQRASKGFAGGNLLTRLRQRPATPALAMLARRLSRKNRRVDARREAGEALAAAAGVARPGEGVGLHTHWVFPVLDDDPHGPMRRLRSLGFDSTRATTSLGVVESPPERPDVRAAASEALVARMLFVPAYPEIPEAELRRLGAALREWSQATSRSGGEGRGSSVQVGRA